MTDRGIDAGASGAAATPPSERAVDGLLAALHGAVPGDAIATDPDTLARYARDESEVDPQVPGAVVFATSTSDVSRVLAAASQRGVPVTPRAAGTGRVGGAVPVRGGVVLSLERMNRIRGVEGDDLYAVVEPGVVTGRFQEAVAREGFLYGPDPSSWETCTLGGNVAANAGGPRAFKYGVTRDWVLGLEVVRGDGTVMRVGRRTRKGVVGYDLTALVVGSEGTLGVVTEATLRLLPRPGAVVTVLCALPDEDRIGPAVSAALGRGVLPRCVELLDGETLAVVRPESQVPIPPEARALLLIELDGEPGDLGPQLERLANALTDAGALEVRTATDVQGREALWSARRRMSRTLRTLARNKMSEDVAVPRSRLGALIAEIRRISADVGVRMPAYGHAGDGNLHVNFLWDGPDEWPRVRTAIRRLFEATIALGGTLSGEHGLGVLKAPYLPLEQPADLIAFQEQLKHLFDPRGILNPGKVFPAGAARWHGAC